MGTRYGAETQYQGRDGDWSPDDGWTSTEKYSGDIDAIEDLADLYAVYAQGVSRISVAQDYDKGDLRLVFVDDPNRSSQNNPDDNSAWELVGNMLHIDLRQHPFLGDEDAEDINDIDKNYIATGQPYSGSGALQKYYDLRSKGTDTYITFQPVIRQRISKHRDNSNFEPDYTNAGREVALSTIGAPAAILGGLDSLPIVDKDGNVTYGEYEWLKIFPRVNLLNEYRIEVMYEWWGAPTWSEVLYGGSGDP